MKFAYLFPGQGAQYSGMALDFLVSDAVKSLFNTASEIFGKDVKEILNADAEVLKRSEVAQPAITVANLAAAAYLGEHGYSPAACAGFSLGEYAALVCAGIIDTKDCLRLVKVRGEAMQTAADRLREAALQNSNTAGEALAAPGMAAVVGLAPAQVEELIAKWKEEAKAAASVTAAINDLYAANINSPKQLVISGTAAALTEAEKLFKDAGARRVIRLQVAGPFHSPLMVESLRTFLPELEKVTFRNPSIPIFSNVTGKAITCGAEAKELTIKHITNPVRWVEEESVIAASGIQACLEVGPGSVLQGLWKDVGSVIPVFAAGTVEDIDKLKEKISGEKI